VKKNLAYFVSLIGALVGLVLLTSVPSGCGIYKLNDATVPDSIKTVKINFIENRASYVNPQLSPRLTDRLRQKIIGQTRLTQTNGQADWEVSGHHPVCIFNLCDQWTTSGDQPADRRHKHHRERSEGE
jgi:hypothetical protein